MGRLRRGTHCGGMFSCSSGHASRQDPGSDGFPMEFFLTFWQSLGADLFRVLNVTDETDQLSSVGV